MAFIIFFQIHVLQMQMMNDLIMMKLPCCSLVLIELLVFKQAFALIVFSDGLKNEMQRTEQQF